MAKAKKNTFTDYRAPPSETFRVHQPSQSYFRIILVDIAIWMGAYDVERLALNRLS
jgi:hypothetical protein